MVEGRGHATLVRHPAKAMPGALKPERAQIHGTQRAPGWRQNKGPSPYTQQPGHSDTWGQGHLPKASLGQLAVVGDETPCPSPSSTYPQPHLLLRPSQALCLLGHCPLSLFSSPAGYTSVLRVQIQMPAPPRGTEAQVG